MGIRDCFCVTALGDLIYPCLMGLVWGALAALEVQLYCELAPQFQSCVFCFESWLPSSTVALFYIENCLPSSKVAFVFVLCFASPVPKLCSFALRVGSPAPHLRLFALWFGSPAPKLRFGGNCVSQSWYVRVRVCSRGAAGNF